MSRFECVDGMLRLWSMALKYGNFQWRKMLSNRRCDLQWTHTSRMNKDVTPRSILSAICHKVFQMRQIIQYTMILMPVDAFGRQSSLSLKGILASWWKIHLITTTLPLQTTSSCSGSFWQNTAHNEARNVKMRQLFRPFRTTTILQKLTLSQDTQLNSHTPSLKFTILKWAFSILTWQNTSRYVCKFNEKITDLQPKHNIYFFSLSIATCFGLNNPSSGWYKN